MIHVVRSDLALHGRIYVKFADIRDADKVFSTVQHRDASWIVQHIGPGQFVVNDRPEGLQPSPDSIHEGQILVKAEYLGMPQRFDSNKIGCTVLGVLKRYGDVMAFCVESAEAYVATFRAEYYDIHATSQALANIDGVKIAVGLPPAHSYQQPANTGRCAP